MVGLLKYAAAIVGLAMIIMVATSWMPIHAASTLFAVIIGFGLVASLVLGLCGMVSVLVGGLSGGVRR